MVARKPLEVMITVDVEAWPRCPQWRGDDLARDLARDVYGVTLKGEFGIQYQVDLLRQHGLKGVFFVEALMACEIGIQPLAKIVDVIQQAGSEVQLHIHTEWFEKMSKPLLGETRAYNIRELSHAQQMQVIGRAIENLKSAGVKDVIAYRAGNFGADFQTLSALAECGIRYDSSYNYSYLSSECGLDVGPMLVQPSALEGVIEYPVSCFRDYPGHYRPAQLCAVSAKEMQAALLAALEAEWKSFVIVSHSFELLRDRKRALPHAYPDWSVIQRFEDLCEFLSSHKGQFRTTGFADVSELPETVPQKPLHLPLAKSATRTVLRMLSQSLRRLPQDQEAVVRKTLARVGLEKF